MLLKVPSESFRLLALLFPLDHVVVRFLRLKLFEQRDVLLRYLILTFLTAGASDRWHRHHRLAVSDGRRALRTCWHEIGRSCRLHFAEQLSVTFFNLGAAL